jgi:2-desacetyl-2-hydroxyethyl bacteriochlorophyllide A dehydrogenase
VRAVVLTGPGDCEVRDVDPPLPGPLDVVVDVERVGVCGTDVELFAGTMPYFASGHATYPIRPGHEWCGRVSAVGEQVDRSVIGIRVTGDTMIGCGHCDRCRTGRHHVCDARSEVGIRGGLPGALAEKLCVPAGSLVRLPAGVDEVAGALAEPAGTAVRAVEEAHIGPGARVLVLGAGTIGLLVALVAIGRGAVVEVVDHSHVALDLARSLGATGAWASVELCSGPYDAVVDASTSASLPRLALDAVEPGRRVVLVGLAGSPSMLDARELVLRDVTAVGVLGGSSGIARAVKLFASGGVDPRPVVAATVGLDAVGRVLAGWRPAGCGPGPKIHVDPR